MSNLRIAGIIVGIIGLLAAFAIYRGPKWKKANFIVFSMCNIILIAISADPNLVNIIRDLLSLHQFKYGRLFAVIIVSIVFLLFYTFSIKSKLENLRLQMDKLIRKLGTSDFEDNIEIKQNIKPITIVIPAYNEAHNLNELLSQMPNQINGTGVGVLVVDDGSEDNTEEIVNLFGYSVVTNKIRRGQGSASRLGYDILIKYGVSIGVTMDADLQHRPEDIKHVVLPIIEKKYDLVIGSRILGDQEKVNWLRNIGVYLLSSVINLISGLKITDCSSGFKAFDVRKLSKLDLTEDQFQASEILIEASKKKLKIGEAPITIDRRKYGKSKKGTDWSYGLNFAKTILKTWWR